ncbi:hypothetical protein CBR_g45454 [Chara braunii]|uniref:DEAD-box RNA helicase n=1 Tax=Chara braunii TaxID=69332 RepID=A0A388LYK5_CHABU|nr:hypothetical protein CBR_g45454 [Chara braunii]|eukprot:GBG87397.1 hypothetical protein CBR_g45454 [Chara braunii]
MEKEGGDVAGKKLKGEGWQNFQPPANFDMSSIDTIAKEELASDDVELWFVQMPLNMDVQDLSGMRMRLKLSDQEHSEEDGILGRLRLPDGAYKVVEEDPSLTRLMGSLVLDHAKGTGVAAFRQFDRRVTVMRSIKVPWLVENEGTKIDSDGEDDENEAARRRMEVETESQQAGNSMAGKSGEAVEKDGGEGKGDNQSGAAGKFIELGICSQLADAAESMGWKAPSAIQAESIPHALEGRDIIALAQTGSGKTAAFAIPILQALLEKPQPLFACVLSPTRELAIQIAEQFEALGSGIGVKCAVVVGGIDMMAQSIALAKRPHIVVGTPGRLVDHLSNTKGFNIRTVKYLVLDEADRLLNMDFEKEIDEILKVAPRDRRTYLFSATMTSKVAKLQRACLKNPVKVEVCSKYTTVDTLRQQYMFVPAKFKDCYFVYLMNEIAGNTAMVFTRTCDGTTRLALLLRNLGFDSIPISGQLSQPKRLGALAKFKAGERSILICTDVASRGLDIPSVDVVINYDIPTNSKDYIHRVGRTARAGRSGRAVSIVTQYDVELYQKIEHLVGKKMEAFPAEQEDVLLLQERVNDAQRMAITYMKEKDSNRKGAKRRKGGDEGDDDVRFKSAGKGRQRR